MGRGRGGSTKNENENVATAKTDSCNLHICNATRLSVHQTTLLASQRVASFANTGRTRQTKLNQKPQSQKKKAGGVGGGAASEADNKVFFAYAKSAVESGRPRRVFVLLSTSLYNPPPSTPTPSPLPSLFLLIIIFIFFLIF